MDRKTRLDKIKQTFTATHPSRYDTPFSLLVYFKVGEQSFQVGQGFTEEEAQWMREMLATALDKAVKRINKWEVK